MGALHGRVQLLPWRPGRPQFEIDQVGEDFFRWRFDADAALEPKAIGLRGGVGQHGKDDNGDDGEQGFDHGSGLSKTVKLCYFLNYVKFLILN